MSLDRPPPCVRRANPSSRNNRLNPIPHVRRRCKVAVRADDLATYGKSQSAKPRQDGEDILVGYVIPEEERAPLGEGFVTHELADPHPLVEAYLLHLDHRLA